jgi:hypothetical protein
MNEATLPKDYQRDYATSQYVPQQSAFRLPNIKFNMATIPASVLLLLASAGLILSDYQQAVIIGGVLAGSAFGSIAKVCYSMLAKSQKKVPGQMIFIRFAFHACAGTMIGVGGMFAVIYWWHFQEMLLMLAIAVGGASGFLADRILKKAEPRILRMLEDRGYIEKPNPPSREIDLTAWQEPPTAQTRKIT